MTQAKESSPTQDPLHPSGALLTPLFLIALLTLALNDQLLKGAGLLPGWLTGKLSDVAGLIVLPVVLAVVFRVRSKAGFTIAQLVSVGFLAALQFSPWFEESWTALVGLVGIPWHNTADPSDMIAVVALIPARTWLLPAMRRAPQAATRRSGPRLAQALILGASSVVLMGTSQRVCDNFTETEGVMPHDAVPHYPGDLSGEEVLARIGARRTLAATYSAGEPFYAPCEETKNNPPTNLTVSIDGARAVTHHRTIEIDESVSTTDCRSMVEGTSVRIEVPITISTADGQVLVSDTVTIGQLGDGDSDGRTLQWALGYWSDAHPTQLGETLERLKVPAERFTGFKITWNTFADGTTRGALELVRDHSYENCTVLGWQETP